MKDLIVSTLPTLPIVGNLRVTRTRSGLFTAISPSLERRNGRLGPLEEDCYEKFLLYLHGNSKEINLPVSLEGVSLFQKKLLDKMKNIPYGELKSYKDLAEDMNSRAYQAVGSGCGRNPLLIIFPCHRVIGRDGLGGFAHGLKMKRSLLELEGIFLS
jgi:O-6-methylguanine DNA methyltransferase